MRTRLSDGRRSGARRARWSALVVIALALAAVAVPAALAITVTGSLTNTDPTQTDRLFRTGVLATCAVPKASPGLAGFSSSSFHYDAYTFSNTSASPQCVTVTLTTACSGAQFIHGAAYSTFVPSNPSTNYLADVGPSPFPTSSMSFTVPAFSQFVIVVSEVTPNSGCASYTLDVTGTGIIQGPLPTCGGLNATIFGSGVVMGTPGDDVIVGSSGRDVIFGNGGNDRICGGQNNDVIFGGEGNDTIFGDDGNLPTDPGGNDSLYGENGNDTLIGEAGNDTVSGGADNDAVLGGLGNDSLTGDAGSDSLTGDAGADSLDGGTGNDVLTGSAGSDALFGQAGTDTLNGDLGPTPPGTLDPAPNSDSCDGGPDADTAVFCEAPIAIP